MKVLIFSLILWSLPLFAQRAAFDPKVEEAKAAKEAEEMTARVAQYHKDILKSDGKIQELESQMMANEMLLMTRESNKKNVVSEARALINSASGFKKIFQKKSKFYQCILDGVEASGHANFNQCQTLHDASFSEQEKSKIDDWKRSVGASDEEIEKLNEKLLKQVESEQEKIDSIKTDILYAKQRINHSSQVIDSVQPEIIDQKTLDEHKEYMGCNVGSPSIDLEEKIPYPGAKFSGPFVNIPRDNQGSIGVCYAVSAKNMLVGLSRGEANASFMDAGLQYKAKTLKRASLGLEGGDPCSTLETLKLNGYCPVQYSPYETGNTNPITEALISKQSNNVLDQSKTVSLLAQFFEGKKNYEESMKKLDPGMLNKMKSIVDDLKRRPDVVLPLPIVRHEIPGLARLTNTYDAMKGKTFSEKEFVGEYQKQYRQFYPAYLRAVLDGQSLTNIFEIYKQIMKPFNDKYGLTEENLKNFKIGFAVDAHNDYVDPKVKQKVRASLDYLKNLTDKTSMSDNEFISFCNNNFQEGTEFLSSIQQLVTHLKATGIQTDNLFNENGELKNPTDLMQLAVAPACINGQNREKVDYKFSCKDHNVSKLKKSGDEVKMREKIIPALLDGMPVGNVFGMHTNTIVGMRFNPVTRNCEYKIRESQTGQSDWQNEAEIMKLADFLTIVRRR